MYARSRAGCSTSTHLLIPQVDHSLPLCIRQRRRQLHQIGTLVARFAGGFILEGRRDIAMHGFAQVVNDAYLEQTGEINI